MLRTRTTYVAPATSNSACVTPSVDRPRHQAQRVVAGLARARAAARSRPPAPAWRSPTDRGGGRGRGGRSGASRPRRSRRAGRAGRSRARAAAPACCPRTGRRRCARPPRSPRGGPGSSAATTGRPRSAQQASCRPWVQTQSSDPPWGARPVGRPAPSAARSRSRSARGSARTPASRRGRAGSAYAAKTRIPCWWVIRSCRRIISTRTFAAVAASRRAGPRRPGSRLSRIASTPQGPVFSTSRNARTVEAVPSTGSSRSTLAPAHRKSRLAGGAGSTRTTSSSPSRTRRRHSTRRLCSSSRPAGRRAAARRARTSSSAGGSTPGTCSERSPSSTSTRSPRSSSTHGCPCRRRSTVLSSRSRTASTSCSPPGSRGRRPVRKRRTSSSTAAEASMSRTAGRPPRAGRRARRRASGPVEVAGRQVLVGHAGEGRPHAALDQAAPGELVDPEGHVQRDRLLGAGGVRGAGGEVHRQAGLEDDVLDAVGRVHLPLLGAGRLEDEHVVGVGVDVEALRARRREVGVGLAGVAELELELGDQPGQRRPVAVQALEHDGRAVVEERQRLAGVHESGERLAGERRAAGVRRLRQHRAVPGEPDRRGADRGGGQQLVDVGERQQTGQVLGIVRCRCTVTPRPSRGRSGRRR